MSYVTVWRSIIDVLRPIPYLPKPLVISRERQSSTGYHINNADRMPMNRYTFQYSLHGRGCLSWRGQIYTVPQGHGFLVRTNDPEIIYYYPEDAQEAWQFVFFDFSGDLDTSVAAISTRWGPVHALDPHKGLVQRLLDFEQYSDQMYNMTASRGADLVGDLFVAILKSHELEEDSRRESFIVRRAQTVLQTELGSGINAGELAEKLEITREHLSRLFKAELGISPYQYILQQRLSRAVQLLKNSTLTCKQISHDCGFETSSLFNNAFKQAYGITPRRYRQQSGG